MTMRTVWSAPRTHELLINRSCHFSCFLFDQNAGFLNSSALSQHNQRIGQDTVKFLRTSSYGIAQATKSMPPAHPRAYPRRSFYGFLLLTHVLCLYVYFRYEGCWQAICNDVQAVIVCYNSTSRDQANEVLVWCEWFIKHASLTVDQVRTDYAGRFDFPANVFANCHFCRVFTLFVSFVLLFLCRLLSLHMANKRATAKPSR